MVISILALLEKRLVFVMHIYVALMLGKINLDHYGPGIEICPASDFSFSPNIKIPVRLVFNLSNLLPLMQCTHVCLVCVCVSVWFLIVRKSFENSQVRVKKFPVILCSKAMADQNDTITYLHFSDHHIFSFMSSVLFVDFENIDPEISSTPLV